MGYPVPNPPPSPGPWYDPPYNPPVPETPTHPPPPPPWPPIGPSPRPPWYPPTPPPDVPPPPLVGTCVNPPEPYESWGTTEAGCNVFCTFPYILEPVKATSCAPGKTCIWEATHFTCTAETGPPPNYFPWKCTAYYSLIKNYCDGSGQNTPNVGIGQAWHIAVWLGMLPVRDLLTERFQIDSSTFVSRICHRETHSRILFKFMRD